MMFFIFSIGIVVNTYKQDFITVVSQCALISVIFYLFYGCVR